MNLREWNDSGRREEVIHNILKLFSAPVIFILTAFYLYFYTDLLKDYKFATILVIFIILLVYFLLISMTRTFNQLKTYKTRFLSICICHKCLGSVNLWTDDEEEWVCNYCKKSFSGNVLRGCPNCYFYQRLFECPLCGELIDIEAEYDFKKLKGLRHVKQTSLLQQKNQSPKQIIRK